MKNIKTITVVRIVKSSSSKYFYFTVVLFTTIKKCNNISVMLEFLENRTVGKKLVAYKARHPSCSGENGLENNLTVSKNKSKKL